MQPFTKFLAVLAALAATGCAAPVAPPVAPPVATATTATKVVGEPVYRLQEVYKDEVLDLTAKTGPAVVRHWTFEPGTEETVDDRYEVTYETLTWQGKRGPITKTFDIHTRLPDLFYANFTYSGDGAIMYMGNARYKYKAPADRYLVINRLQGSVLLDGGKMESHYELGNWMGQDGRRVASDIDVLVAPGDSIVITAQKGDVLTGYTCDPAKLGLGPTPGQIGAEAVGAATGK